MSPAEPIWNRLCLGGDSPSDFRRYSGAIGVLLGVIIKRLLLAGATIASLIATNAFAADLPVYTKAPPPVVAVYNWTGFYVGGNVGYSWGRSGTI